MPPSKTVAQLARDLDVISDRLDRFGVRTEQIAQRGHTHANELMILAEHMRAIREDVLRNRGYLEGSDGLVAKMAVVEQQVEDICADGGSTASANASGRWLVWGAAVTGALSLIGTIVLAMKG